ncbi:MAG: sigma-70 family RNA polymerase sigma factor [Bacteroidales bacterium]|nr:sigma-70 family RNA polymerase sigma factor [Bacteroidales bacterium]
MHEELIDKDTISKLLRLVRLYVLKNSGSIQDVEDVMQDGLLTFFQKYAKKELVISEKPEYYIFSICKYIWLKELEKRKRIQLSGNYLVEEIEDSDCMIKEKERKEKIIEILEINIKLLSTKCQKVFDLRRDGLTCKEIAEVLQLKNDQMVKDKHYRCKQRLLELVKQDKAYRDFINDA